MKKKLLGLVCLLIFAGQVSAITNGTVPASLETRYDAVGAFAVSWRLGFDHGSHDDDADHSWFCSATLVNQTKILVAKHCLDAYGTSATYMVRFRRQTDGSLGSVTAGVSSFYHARIASWTWISTDPAIDIALGTLENPVTHFPSIPISVESLYAEEPITVAGWGREGPNLGSGQTVRLLTCPTAVVSTTADELSAWLKSPYFPVPPAAPEAACGINTWDSGGAGLVVDNCGNPSLVAVIYGYNYVTLVPKDVYDLALPSVFRPCMNLIVVVGSKEAQRGRVQREPRPGASHQLGSSVALGSVSGSRPKPEPR